MIALKPFTDLDDVFDVFRASALTRPRRASYPISSTTLQMDMKETDKSYEATFNMPGIKKDDVKISIDEGILTVTVDHKEEKEGKDEKSKYHWKERTSGHVSRSIQLPKNTQLDNISAKLEEGVLKVTAPKAAEHETKKYISIE